MQNRSKWPEPLFPGWGQAGHPPPAAALPGTGSNTANAAQSYRTQESLVSLGERDAEPEAGL